MAAMAARGSASAAKKANKTTIGGVWLFIIGLSVFASGVEVLRFPIGNLRMQPALIFVGLAVPLVFFRISKFPTKVLVSLLLFWTIYNIALIGPSIQKVTPLGDAVKLASAMLMILTGALLVSSRADFVLGATGLAIAIGGLATRGLEEERENIIEVANKNSYSMYALPVVLLAVFIAVRTDWKKVSFRLPATIITLFCSLVAAVAIISGANRSGYVGLALIVLMMGLFLAFSKRLKLGRKSQGAILLICVTVAAIVGVVYKGTEVFTRRYEQTVEGNSSDTLRIDLFKTAVMIGIEHPVRGVSPQQLPVMLAERIEPDANPGFGMETHNVFAHIIGGTGLISFTVLLYLAWSLWFWKPRRAGSPEAMADFYDARALLRMMLVLWAIRGSFSQEILYNPGFCMGLGLAIGLCMVELDVVKKSMWFNYPAAKAMPGVAPPRP